MATTRALTVLLYAVLVWKELGSFAKSFPFPLGDVGPICGALGENGTHHVPSAIVEHRSLRHHTHIRIVFTCLLLRLDWEASVAHRSILASEFESAIAAFLGKIELDWNIRKFIRIFDGDVAGLDESIPQLLRTQFPVFPSQPQAVRPSSPVPEIRTSPGIPEGKANSGQENEKFHCSSWFQLNEQQAA
jgi:hypothetical protein